MTGGHNSVHYRRVQSIQADAREQTKTKAQGPTGFVGSVLWSIPAVVGLLSVVLAVVVLAGYWTQHEWPAVPFFNAAPLMPVTAIMIGLAGLSLVLTCGRRRGPSLHAASRLLAVLVILVSGGLLMQYATGIDLRLVSPFERDVTGPPWPLEGMPSPYTAGAMLLLGLSLLLLQEYGV